MWWGPESEFLALRRKSWVGVYGGGGFMMQCGGAAVHRGARPPEMSIGSSSILLSTAKVYRYLGRVKGR